MLDVSGLRLNKYVVWGVVSALVHGHGAYAHLIPGHARSFAWPAVDVVGTLAALAAVVFDS